MPAASGTQRKEVQMQHLAARLFSPVWNPASVPATPVPSEISLHLSQEQRDIKQTCSTAHSGAARTRSRKLENKRRDKRAPFNSALSLRGSPVSQGFPLSE